jgi:cytochrome c556
MHRNRKILLGTLFAVLSVFTAAELFAQADVIEKRQKLMKSNSEAAKAIKAAAESKDYATIEMKAKDITGNAEKIVAAFPKGSTLGKTKAKPEIWEKPDDFAKNAKNLDKAATELADAAKAKDDAAVTAKVKGLGEACGNCHKAFRAEKYPE